MSKALVIVESPSKAKTINKYLGRDYKVLASVGHVKDLPKKGLGVDVENDFEPTYEIMPGKEKVVKQIKDAAKDADEIYVATDPDREGEAIGYHIAEIVKSGRGQAKKPIFRVMFNEITKDAVQEAFKHPGQIDTTISSTRSRRAACSIAWSATRVSPLLWDKVRRGLSAGRVQTVAVRLVVEREREIQAFVKTEYWTITADLSAQLPPAFDARLYKIAEQTVKTSGFDQGVKKGRNPYRERRAGEEDPRRARRRALHRQRCRDAERRSATRSRPSSPRSCNRKHRASCVSPAKRTMQIAQKSL